MCSFLVPLDNIPVLLAMQYHTAICMVSSKIAAGPSKRSLCLIKGYKDLRIDGCSCMKEGQELERVVFEGFDAQPG